MKSQRHLMTKVLLGGLLLATLVYLFHPGVGQLGLVINGEPVTNSLVRFAAFPTLIMVLLIFAALSLLLFLGVGVMMFLGALCFASLGIFIIAPYFWPMLMIIVLFIALMSIGHGSSR